VTLRSALELAAAGRSCAADETGDEDLHAWAANGPAICTIVVVRVGVGLGVQGWADPDGLPHSPVRGPDLPVAVVAVRHGASSREKGHVAWVQRRLRISLSRFGAQCPHPRIFPSDLARSLVS